jgi:hypothetical protein
MCLLNIVFEVTFEMSTFQIFQDLLNPGISARCQWLMPVILTAWKAEIRRISVTCQPREIVHKTPSPK